MSQPPDQELSKRKELGELALRNAEGMAFPPSAWEAETLNQVLTLPRVTVTRPPPDQLLAAGMAPYDCHRNCAEQEANDPDRRSRHVWGWLINGSDLILHSVVEIGGKWVCLTPQLIPASPTFQFIPDPTIEWRDEPGTAIRNAFRNGTPVPDALRKYPELHIRMRDEFFRLVATGVQPYEARQVVDDTLGAEHRKKAPI